MNKSNIRQYSLFVVNCLKIVFKEVYWSQLQVEPLVIRIEAGNNVERYKLEK